MIDEETETPARIYFSAQDRAFLFLSERSAYDAAGTWPQDAIEVTVEEWEMYGQQPPPQGMRRGSDEQGRPTWIKPEVPLEDLAGQERAWRDRQLGTTDPLVTRHRDQMEAERDTTLSKEEYQALQAYRLDLRDWPSQPGFPDPTLRPKEPLWLQTTIQ
ncbi:phage tail protein [Pseudomonas gessardii]|uniref:phage tail assembly chaperone n=1 Tax=Pseudomonas gessardii TaxID=78544 RepID=UPI001FA57B90|nr:phage tail assembly chaperone [Pseudomonas gessardii]MCF5086791.1 phage tail protein [Pseudomonas gessardii]